MVSRAVALFAFTMTVCTASVAHAEKRADSAKLTVALHYSVAGDCPSVEDFQAIVSNRLAYNPFREDAADHVLVRVAPHGRGYAGRIEWRDARGAWVGDRRFPSRSENCRDLGRAMAFALALQIQLSALAKAHANPPPALPETESATDATTEAGALAASPATAAATPPASSPPVPAPPPEPAPVPAPEPAPAKTAQEPDPSVPEKQSETEIVDSSASDELGTTYRIGAGALGAAGMSSELVPFGRLIAAVAWTHLSFEATAEAGWPSTIRRADGAGFTQQHLLVGLAACGAVGAWAACLVGKGGEVRIAGKDIDVAAHSSGAIVQSGLRIAFTQRLGQHLYIAARAEGLVNAIRWRVTLDDVAAWTSGRFAATFGIDAGVDFR
jgi:hypothetical protein